MMEDGTLERVIQLKRAEGAERNREARAILGDLAAPGARCAWHLWVRLPDSVDSREIEQKLRDKEVLVTAGHWCAAGPEFGKGIRLALGGEIERKRTLDGVRIVAETYKNI